MIQILDFIVNIEKHTLFKVEEFSIQKGNVYYLLGKNGSGKSTFLKSIISPNNTKNIQIDGKEKGCYSPKELAKKIAFVPSKLSSDNYITVEDFLLLGRYPYGSKLASISNEDKELIEEALCVLQMESYRHHFVRELSDGQQQLISIGRTLVQKVDYLLLDEPTAFLDYINKRKIFHLMEHLAVTKQMGIVVVTHDIEHIVASRKDIYYVDVEKQQLILLPAKEQTDFEKTVSCIYKEE